MDVLNLEPETCQYRCSIRSRDGSVSRVTGSNVNGVDEGTETDHRLSAVSNRRLPGRRRCEFMREDFAWACERNSLKQEYTAFVPSSARMHTCV